MSQADKTFDLSVVVLAYRAEEYIVDFISQLQQELTVAGIGHQIVIVANYMAGQADRTPDIVKKEFGGNDHIKIISREKEGMMGWDMRSGLNEAEGRYIAVIDGDGQMPVSDVVQVYKIIQTGDYDLVKTFRAKRFDGFYRSTISAIYNFLFRLLFPFDYQIKDVNSKPKIFTRKAYLDMNLRSNDWFTDAEIMIEAMRLKLRICQVSTIFYRNERRKTFVGIRTIFEFIYNLIYYRVKW